MMVDLLCAARVENSTESASCTCKPVYAAIIPNIAISSFLCYTTAMMNIVTIYALGKTSSILKPLKILLLSLAVSDLCTGLLSLPLNIAWQIQMLRCNLDKIPAVLNVFCSNFLYLSSLLGLTVLSADRFVAIQMPLRYKELVTHKVAFLCYFFSDRFFLYASRFFFCDPFYNRVNLLCSFDMFFFQGIFDSEAPQAPIPRPITTGCSKQWTNSRETPEICTWYVLDLSRVLGLLSAEFYCLLHFSSKTCAYWNANSRNLRGDACLCKFIPQPYHILLEDETYSTNHDEQPSRPY